MTIDSELIRDILHMTHAEAILATPDGGHVALLSSRWDGQREHRLPRVEFLSDGSRTRRRRTVDGFGEITFPRLLPDGSLVFGGRMANGGSSGAGVWRLSPDDESPRLAVPLPSGAGRLAVSDDGTTMVVALGVLPDARSPQHSRDLLDQRKRVGRSALVFDGPSVSDLDRRRGPDEIRLYLVRAGDDDHDITPTGLPGVKTANELTFALSGDGRRLAVARQLARRGDDAGDSELAVVDTRSGHTLWRQRQRCVFEAPTFSPQGDRLVVVRHEIPTRSGFGDTTIWLFDTESGHGSDLLPDLDLWPMEPTWSASGQALYFTAWSSGNRPIYRCTLDRGREHAGETERMTDTGHFAAISGATDDGLYALNSTPVSPPSAVRVTDGVVRTLVRTELPVRLRGARLRRHEATSFDGVTVGSWLVMPASDAEDGQPRPMLVNIHGGPEECFSGWAWNFAAALFVAAGFVVLTPDASSTPGYGTEFYQRGYGVWDTVTRQDILAAIDGVVAELDVDPDRIALLGASFGGLMVNLLITGERSFACAVSHAGIWDMRQFLATTDDAAATWLVAELGDPWIDAERYDQVTAFRQVTRVDTPVLVSHGGLDYRVPVDQALAMHGALHRAGKQSRLLIFENESHVLSRPANVGAWYEEVLRFLRESGCLSGVDRAARRGDA